MNFVNRGKLVLISSMVSICICTILLASESVDAKPFSLYDELSDEKLYQRMVDFIDAIGTDDELSARRPSIRAEERCRMPIRKGVCRALIPRWSYDPETRDCKEFKFGGCDGNANNFLTHGQCMSVCKGL